MVIIEGIISLVLSFLWTWLLLRGGAQIVDSKEGLWKKCAILIGSYWAIAIAAILLAIVTSAIKYFFFITFLIIFLFAVFFYLAIKILDITFLDSVVLAIFTGGFNWIVFFLLGKLEGILPGVSFIISHVSFWGLSFTTTIH
jgi:hypothetical protein